MPAPTAQVDEEKALGHYGYLTKQVEDVQAAKGEQCKIIVLRPERFKLVSVPRLTKRQRALCIVKFLILYLILYHLALYTTIYSRRLLNEGVKSTVIPYNK